jgi:pimeloyl-ACP methyl ester carboxylesterase
MNETTFSQICVWRNRMATDPSAPLSIERGERRLGRRFLAIPRWRRLLTVVLCTYIGVIVLTAAFQAKLIYFPSRVLELTPASVGLRFDDVTLTTDDGVKISAWFVPREGARATIVFFHGNAGNNGDRVPELQVLNFLGFAAMIVDYRGYGKSEGSPGETGTYLDAEAAWKYLTQTRGLAPESIVILGESIGGAVAIELALRHTPGALVVQSSFTSLADIAAIHYPLLPVRWLIRHRYDSIDKVGRIPCPKLFIHSTDDSLIPLVNGRALFDAAAEPKQFLETPGEHNGGGFMYSDSHAAKLRAFVKSALPPGR